METKHKLLLTAFTIIVSFFTLGLQSHAETYTWVDFTTPFKEKLRVSSPVNVEVDLPAPILKEFKKLPLIVEHLGVGSDEDGTWRGILTINNQSVWKNYSFGQGLYTDDPIQLSLNSKNFKPGRNTLRFGLQAGVNVALRWYTITELRFDLPGLEKIKLRFAKTSPPTKADESQNSRTLEQSQKAEKSKKSQPTASVYTDRSPSGTYTSAGTGSEQISFGEYHALVIGNNSYQKIRKLKTAVNDAKSVASLLSEKYNFKVTLLINATRSDIFSALSRVRHDLQITDNLLIYYAGHGNIDKQTQRGYWLPVDAERTTKANWVSNEDITNELKAMRAKHVLVIADSCFSGTLTRGPDIATMRAGGLEEWIRRMAKRRSRTVLSSGGLEPVLDSGGGAHSVFANAFLQTLKENNLNIDMDSLYETIRRRVVLNARQTPLYSDIRFANHDDGDFVFIPR